MPFSATGCQYGPAGPARPAQQLCRYLEYPGTLGKGANQVPIHVREGQYSRAQNGAAGAGSQATRNRGSLALLRLVACSPLQQIILSDRIATTPEMAPIFAEALLLMPHCYIVPPHTRTPARTCPRPY